jgi:hypothetical protein
MLKAADALAAEGYAVRVVSARFMDWATEADEGLRRCAITWRGSGWPGWARNTRRWAGS